MKGDNGKPPAGSKAAHPVLQGLLKRRDFVIHGNALEAIDANYKRYLEKRFRETFSLVGTPLRIELRSSKNPFARNDK